MSDATLTCPACKGSGQISAKVSGVGAVIAARRAALGLTQAALAVRTGLSRSHVASLETGRRGLAIEEVRSFATALSLDPEALVP